MYAGFSMRNAVQTILSSAHDWRDFADRDNFSLTIYLKTKGINTLLDQIKLACHRVSLADWIKPNF
jgi:hypothetical protein